MPPTKNPKPKAEEKAETKVEEKAEAALPKMAPPTGALTEEDEQRIMEEARAKLEAEFRDKMEAQLRQEAEEKVRAQLEKEALAEARKKGKVRNVTIPNFDDRYITGKVRIIDDPMHGFLFPEQVVEVTEKDWSPGLDKLIKIGRLRETSDKPTRPLRFETAVEVLQADPRNQDKSKEEVEELTARLRQAQENLAAIRLDAQKLHYKR